MNFMRLAFCDAVSLLFYEFGNARRARRWHLNLRRTFFAQNATKNGRNASFFSRPDTVCPYMGM